MEVDGNISNIKSRVVDIKRAKELMQLKKTEKKEMMSKLDSFLKKDNLSEEEESVFRSLQIEWEQTYTDLAKGTFVRSRAKWIEEGGKNTSYFIALEKRNYKRKSITALKINNVLCKDPITISSFVNSFYENQFWELLEDPIFNMFQDCIKNGEMVSTMKQGLISMKPDKDPSLIDNWRPITLLNTDYKLIALLYAKRLKKGIDTIIN